MIVILYIRMPRCLMDAAVNHYVIPSTFRDLRKDGSTFVAETASGDFPQVAECNTPRSMDATEECSAYDGFKACKIHSAAPAQQSCGQIYENSKVDNEISVAILWTSGSLSQTRHTFA
jgi:hypothetical protein